MHKFKCRMTKLGYSPGSCLVRLPDGSCKSACMATLKKEDGTWFRVIRSAHLSRPEDYFSIYQSGCNHSCLKCHSWEFSKNFNGYWISTDEIAEITADYLDLVTVWEPRERATMYHATELCHHCGSCIVFGRRGKLCPKKLKPEQVVLSPQGYGPARNIIAFTGGDVACMPEFYAQATEKIKEYCGDKLWVLLETNGYGLVRENLEILASAGLDSFWLDIKAYDQEVYKRLCGTTNEWVLKAPELIIDMGFTLEILSLYIPGWVENEQIVEIAKLIHSIDKTIPFTILAFFPAHKLIKNRKPNLLEMVRVYFEVKNIGLKNVKLGNCGVFAKSKEEWELLISLVGKKAIG